jgi:hypothetical protein
LDKCKTIYLKKIVFFVVQDRKGRFSGRRGNGGRATAVLQDRQKARALTVPPTAEITAMQRLGKLTLPFRDASLFVFVLNGNKRATVVIA